MGIFRKTPHLPHHFSISVGQKKKKKKQTKGTHPRNMIGRQTWRGLLSSGQPLSMTKKYVIRQQVERRLASGVPRPYWVCKLMDDGQPARYKIAKSDSWEELQRLKDWAESQMTWDEIVECEATRVYLDCELAAMRPVEPLPEAKPPCAPLKLHEVFRRLVEAGEMDTAIQVLRLAFRAGISLGFCAEGVAGPITPIQ